MAKVMRGDLRIESLRVVGALAVFLFHFMEDAQVVLGPPFARDPLWATIRDLSGPFGVSLFIVISGMVFTWSWPHASNAAGFFRRRLEALFPLYWWIAIPLIALALAAHRMSPWELWKVPVWLTGLGILSPATFIPVVDGWWYMTLALQMVLAYPVLRAMQERLGVEVFVLVSAVISVASVFALQALGLDYAIMGFVGSRLLELGIGMTIGSYIAIGVRAWPKASVLAAMGLSALACVLALPWTFVQVALAPAVVVVVVGVVANPSGRYVKWVAVAGALSFAFYLSHSPWAKPVLTTVATVAPKIGFASPAAETLLAGVLALMVAVVVALGFQYSFIAAREAFKAKRARAL